jgi:cytochrome c-type biogenesis protein CcmH
MRLKMLSAAGLASVGLAMGLAGSPTLGLIAPARAFTLEEFAFEDPAQQAEFRGLIDELRCLVCQNESLSASQADLAQDLRREVYEMMRAGKSKAEVVDFLVARYGDFVLYSPPIKPSTYVLWFGPLALGLLGAVVVLRAIRAKAKAPEEDLSEAERARVAELLAQGGEAAEAVAGPAGKAPATGKGARS